MAYKSVNPYNGKVLRTFDDMTDQTRLCGWNPRCGSPKLWPTLKSMR